MSLLQFEIGILMVAAFVIGFLGVWSITSNKKDS